MASPSVVGPAWADLPNELKVSILSHLSFTQLVQVRQVCREWKVLLDDTHQLWARVKRLTLHGKAGMMIWSGEPHSKMQKPNESWMWSPFNCFDQKPSFEGDVKGALEYLSGRAGLESLEILSLDIRDKVTCQRFETAMWGMKGIKLRSLTITKVEASGLYVPRFQEAFRHLFRTQPTLERLIIGPSLIKTQARRDKEEMTIAPLEDLRHLQNLRVLIFFAKNYRLKALLDIPVPVLGGLDHLSVYFVDDRPLTEGLFQAPPLPTDIQNHIKASAPLLKRRHPEQTDCFIWAKDAVDLGSLMGDKSLHSLNFFDPNNIYYFMSHFSSDIVASDDDSSDEDF